MNQTVPESERIAIRLASRLSWSLVKAGGNWTVRSNKGTGPLLWEGSLDSVVAYLRGADDYRQGVPSQ